MLTNDELTSFLATLGRRIKQLRKEKGLLMRDIMIATGYYDAQWRKYEAGGSLNIASLMKVALALDVTLVDLLEGLGQWPKLSVDEIEKQYGMGPAQESDDSELGSEPETPVRSRRKARSTTNAVSSKAATATSSTAAQKKRSKTARTPIGRKKTASQE